MYCRYCGKATENENGVCDECVANETEVKETEEESTAEELGIDEDDEIRHAEPFEWVAPSDDEISAEEHTGEGETVHVEEPAVDEVPAEETTVEPAAGESHVTSEEPSKYDKMFGFKPALISIITGVVGLSVQSSSLASSFVAVACVLMTIGLALAIVGMVFGVRGIKLVKECRANGVTPIAPMVLSIVGIASSASSFVAFIFSLIGILAVLAL